MTAVEVLLDDKKKEFNTCYHFDFISRPVCFDLFSYFHCRSD